jgi:D-alanyl-D-alanine carboxypeptidase
MLENLLVGDYPLPSLQVVALAGSVSYAQSFGLRDIGAGLEVNNQTRFRVASVSKLLVALGALRLVEQGLLELEADISEYLGFSVRNPLYPSPSSPIKVKHLLSHTSSIRDGARYVLPQPYGIQDFFNEPFAQERFSPYMPGSYAEYANLNTGILGTILESISRQRFDLYMEEHVLRPLGMGGGFNVSRFSPADTANLAVLYRKQGDWIAQVDNYGGKPPLFPTTLGLDDQPTAVNLETYTVGTNATVLSPQGGLRASALELAQVAKLFMGYQALLKPTTLAQMLAAQWSFNGSNGDTLGGLANSWGLGVWHFSHPKLLNGLPLYGHFGDAYGLFSGLLFNPHSQQALIYILGGQSCDPAQYPGLYSGLSRWEEIILEHLQAYCG